MEPAEALKILVDMAETFVDGAPEEDRIRDAIEVGKTMIANIQTDDEIDAILDAAEEERLRAEFENR